MANISGIKYKFYNGGWSSDWASSPGGHQAGGSTCVVAKFDTADISTYDNHITKDLDITVTWKPVGNYVAFTLYAKLYTADPTTKTIDDLKADVKTYYTTTLAVSKPNSSGARTATLNTITGISPATTYYIAFWTSAKNNYPGINACSFSYTYDGWNNATVYAPSIIYPNDKDNHFYLEVASPVAGTNNAIDSCGFTYRIGNNAALSATAHYNTDTNKYNTHWLSFSSLSGGSAEVNADFVVRTEHQTGLTASASSVTVYEYVAPTAPSNVALSSDSLKNNRLTLKKNWSYTWTASTKQGYADVAGYSISIAKVSPDGTETILSGLTATADTNTIIIGIETSNTNNSVDIDTTLTKLTFDPNILGFSVGDAVKAYIWGYCKDGQGSKANLYSGACYSEKTTVQNAGVVRIKPTLDDPWTEGQVWVRAKDKWYEADTVKVKTGDRWEESE